MRRRSPKEAADAHGIAFSCRAKSRHLFLTTLLCGLFPGAAFGRAADPIVVNPDGAQFERGDIFDIQRLATQVLPVGSRVFLLKCCSPRGGDQVGVVTRVEFYTEPFEQTARVWRGFQSGCVRESRYETQEGRTFVAGKWLGDRGGAGQYLVIGAPDQTLPAFSRDRVADFSPVRISAGVPTPDAVAVVDLLRKSPPQSMRKPFRLGETEQIDLSQLTISYIDRRNPGEVRAHFAPQKGVSWSAGIDVLSRRSEGAWNIINLTGWVD